MLPTSVVQMMLGCTALSAYTFNASVLVCGIAEQIENSLEGVKIVYLGLETTVTEAILLDTDPHSFLT